MVKHPCAAVDQRVWCAKMGDSRKVGCGNEWPGMWTRRVLRSSVCRLEDGEGAHSVRGWVDLHIARRKKYKRLRSTWLTFGDAHAMRLAAGRMDFCGTRVHRRRSDGRLRASERLGHATIVDTN